MRGFDEISALLEYERYIPVMSIVETDWLRAGKRDWSREDFLRWEMLLWSRSREREDRIAESMTRSKRGSGCKSCAKGEF